MIKLYLPIYNSATFLENVEIPEGFVVTIVDSASTDDSLAIAEARQWSIAKRSLPASRVENWEFAVRHFIHSQATWCKWLFTGDALYPDAHARLMKAILNAPQARLVIFEYDVIKDGQRQRWKMFPETQVLSPPQTAWLTAKKGNWFGSPVGQCFHRDAVADGFEFGPWTWAADMQFCYTIAKQWPVLYVAESIGEFHTEARKTFAVQCHALSSSVEEYLVRVQAARDYLQMTQDQQGFEELSRCIVQETEALIVSRAFKRQENGADVEHVFNSIPLKSLLKGCWTRIVQKLKSVLH